MTRWKIVNKTNNQDQKLKPEQILEILLKTRGVKTAKQKEIFLNPVHPDKISIKDIGVTNSQISKVINRIKQAKESGEKVIIYGDYDCDGITATAILWETLNAFGLDVTPHIPDRFKEGYGINPKSINDLQSKYPNIGLIITVDNGIVAIKALKSAAKMGIDVIVTDHHQATNAKLPTKYILHSTETGGASLAWVLSRELGKSTKDMKVTQIVDSSLELAAIGTIADQIPLKGINRSIVKYGLDKLKVTKRPGVKELLKLSRTNSSFGTYLVNYIIAPRINAMGRLDQGIQSLRLLCTRNSAKAKDLSMLLNKTNSRRQVMVEKAVIIARVLATQKNWKGVMVLVHESFHEGIIGLVASRMVDEFSRPAIVMAIDKTKIKASARSVKGFNMIKHLRLKEDLLEAVGGHPMAAGFSMDAKNFKTFTKQMDNLGDSFSRITLSKTLYIDIMLNFTDISLKLVGEFKKLEPYGAQNPAPIIGTKGAQVVNASVVGKDRKHLKLTLSQGDKYIDAIAFGFGELGNKLKKGDEIDVAYSAEINEWNGTTSLQLNIKDIKI